MPKKKKQLAQAIAEEAGVRDWYKRSIHPPLSVTHPHLAKEWHPKKNGAY